MLIEAKLAAWLTAGIELYKASPLLLESVFYDSAQGGSPSLLDAGMCADVEKRWIPHEYTGGLLRMGATTFPILDNDATTLTITGDPSLLPLDAQAAYQIVPPEVQALRTLLQTETFQVSTAFAQVPTSLPAITIRLERDAQSDVYVGESLEVTGADGVEFSTTTMYLTGSYLLSLWAVNRDAVLWLYAWLVNYCLRSSLQFTTWGLSDLTFQGSDLDPALALLPERTSTRHLLLSFSRPERAITTRQVEWISSYDLDLFTHYATLASTYPQPMA